MVIYVAFQIASSPAIHSQHAQALAKPKDAVLTYVLGFLVNSSVAFLLVLGVIAIVNDPGYSNASVPFVLLANNGKHSAIMSTIISVLIVLGSVTTAVNMTSAMTVRICHSLDKNYAFDGKPDKKAMLTILLLTSISFLVARFGLLPVIQKGYSIAAYIALPSICVPYIVHAVYTIKKR